LLFKIAAKPLQIETWLLLTTRHRHIQPYHRRPFKLIQGRWFTRHLKGHMQLPINDQQHWPWLYLSPFLRYGDLSVKKRTFLPHFCLAFNLKMFSLHLEISDVLRAKSRDTGQSMVY